MPRSRSTSSEFRVGLIGFGLGGRSFHAPVISVTPGLRLAAIVTSDPERQEAARAEFPQATVVASAAELLSAKQVDLVVISTPNRTHVPLALDAIASGIPVVVDKPLAPSAADARRVVEAARSRDIFLCVYQNRRWDGDFLTVRRLIAEGALGDIHRFESRFERWRPALKGGWRELAAPDEAGGLLFDLGSHLIDQALVLFGPVKDVYAELDRRRAGAQVDDDGFVALAHESGVHSHLWVTVLAAQDGPRFRVLGSRSAFTKFGTDPQEAALRAGRRPDEPEWGMEPRDLWGTLGIGTESKSVPTERGSYRGFYEGIVRSLRDGVPAPVNPLDAISTLEIIERAQQSASAAARRG